MDVLIIGLLLLQLCVVSSALRFRNFFFKRPLLWVIHYILLVIYTIRPFQKLILSSSLFQSSLPVRKLDVCTWGDQLYFLTARISHQFWNIPVPFIHTSLPNYLVCDLEIVQKRALRIILANLNNNR